MSIIKPPQLENSEKCDFSRIFLVNCQFFFYKFVLLPKISFPLIHDSSPVSTNVDTNPIIIYFDLQPLKNMILISSCLFRLVRSGSEFQFSFFLAIVGIFPHSYAAFSNNFPKNKILSVFYFFFPSTS